MQVKVATTTRKPETQQANYPSYSPFRLLDEFYRDWASRSGASQNESWRPAVDILEKDGNIIIRAELAGVNEKDIDLKLEGLVLTIKGERKLNPEAEGYACLQVESYYGPFSRSFTLPDTVDAEKISARYTNGILIVTLPQKPEVKPRSIKVNG